MNFKRVDSSKQKEISDLFSAVFSSSEGIQEGELIGNLASKLSSNIDNEDIICFCAFDNKSIIGSIFFTRLHFTQPIRVYMLSPVAVSTKHQGKGIGQDLINFGLSSLKEHSVSIVITYGDPSYYSKVGFEKLSESVIQPPLKLSMPIGWLGQSLSNEPIPIIEEQPGCVKEFNDPVYW